MNYAEKLFGWSRIPFVIGLMILAVWAFTFAKGDASIVGRGVMSIGVGIFLLGCAGLLLGVALSLFEVVISSSEYLFDRLRLTDSDTSLKKKKNHETD